MSPNRDVASLLDIARFAHIILQIVQDVKGVKFMNDIKIHSTILYHIILMGEAVKRLSPEFRNKYSNIPWSAIAGMRDKLIHDYDGVNLERVWQTVNISFPELVELIEPLLPKEQ